MCAIVGMINGNIPEGDWQQKHRLLEALFLGAQSYGPDATGFVAQTSPFKRPSGARLVRDKQPLKAQDFIRSSAVWRQLRHQRSQMVLGHVRWATHGSPDESRNNHPFVSRDRRFYLVHNGVLANHADVDERHHLLRDGECDSESLLRLIERVGEPRLGLAACLTEFRGSMAVVLYDAKSRLLWMATNGGRPLWVCRLKNQRGWVFASTSTIVNRALARAFGDGFERRIEVQLPLSPNVIHAVSAEGQLVAVGSADDAKDRFIPEDDE
jgi:glucosamine 6-phosphate synthetase-like amidotransferase/phosphosugar isomerase protein